MQYIYIISNESNHIKVGITKNLKRRLRSLQTGNGDKLTILFSEEFDCTRKHLLSVEKIIHNQLNTNLVKKHGEWYQINNDELQSIKNTIIWHRIRYEDNLTPIETL